MSLPRIVGPITSNSRDVLKGWMSCRYTCYNNPGIIINWTNLWFITSTHLLSLTTGWWWFGMYGEDEEEDVSQFRQYKINSIRELSDRHHMVADSKYIFAQASLEYWGSSLKSSGFIRSWDHTSSSGVIMSALTRTSGTLPDGAIALGLGSLIYKYASQG